MSEHLISVSDEGELQFIYDDEIAFLSDLGQTKTRRMSHVEPTDDNRWTADMQPSGGGILGPYNTRQQALSAESHWIKENVL